MELWPRSSSSSGNFSKTRSKAFRLSARTSHTVSAWVSDSTKLGRRSLPPGHRMTHTVYKRDSQKFRVLQTSVQNEVAVRMPLNSIRWRYQDTCFRNLLALYFFTPAMETPEQLQLQKVQCKLPWLFPSESVRFQEQLGHQKRCRDEAGWRDDRCHLKNPPQTTTKADTNQTQPNPGPPHCEVPYTCPRQAPWHIWADA